MVILQSVWGGPQIGKVHWHWGDKLSVELSFNWLGKRKSPSQVTLSAFCVGLCSQMVGRRDWPCWTCRWTWSLRCLWLHRSSRLRRGPSWSESGCGSCLPAEKCQCSRHSAPHRNTSVGALAAVVPIEAMISPVGTLPCLATLTWSSQCPPASLTGCCHATLLACCFDVAC